MGFLHWENTYFDQLNGVEKKKHFQKIRIVKDLYVNGPLSNSDIYQRLSISSPTSVSLITELINDNLVEKKGLGESSGGRKPELFGLKDNSLFVLGIDMGKYKTRMAIFNNNNDNITGIQTYPLELNNDSDVVEKLHEFGSKLIRSSNINPNKLMGIGISMPGLIDAEKGINFTYLNGLGKPLKNVLEDKFDRPVFIENDAKAMTLAEYRFGLAQGKKDVLVIFVDWGIGLGIIQGGKLYRGTSGFAGEFSHIPLVEDGLLCICGKRGCLETVASATALVRLANKGVREGRSGMLAAAADQSEITEPLAIVDAALKGDQYAISILSEVGFNLGKGLSILIQLFNPEMIILGGRLAEANQYLTTPVQQALNIYCMHQLRERTSIVVSRLGRNAGIMGSVAMVMEHIFEEHIQ